MSKENVKLVRSSFEAFARDFGDAFSSYDPGTEWCTAVDEPDQQTYEGFIDAGDYIDQVFGVFPDWHAWVVTTIDHGDTVVAEIRMAGRGAGSGLEIEQTTWQVTRFRYGKLTGFTAYGDRAQALEAVGLSE